MSDPPKDIPHAEDTFQAGYAAAAALAVARARPGILREAASLCRRMAEATPRRLRVRRRQMFACADAILALIEKEQDCE